MEPVQVLTLDNLPFILQQWDPQDPEQSHAVIDIGSNGIRFSVTSLAAPKTRLLEPLFTERASISLHDALASSSSGKDFSEHTIQEVVFALTRFRSLALMMGVKPTNITMIATEAMRRANNSAQLLKAIADANDGLKVHVLAPEAETLFGAVMGSRSGLVDVKGGALFLDLGGGSVQMTWVDTSVPSYERLAAAAGQSMPYGAAKLTRIFEEETHEKQEQAVHELYSALSSARANLEDKFPVFKAIGEAHDRGDDNAVVNAYLCGGGFRGYASMLIHNETITPYPFSGTHGYSVTSEFFGRSEDMLRVNQYYDGKIYGMSKRRRRQFLAIVTVVDALLHAVPHLGRVTFCGGSNRQGVLMMKLPQNVRESNPLEALSAVSTKEKQPFDAAKYILETALPPKVTSGMPTIFSLGLGNFLVREAWERAGYDDESNSTFAVHNCIVTDSQLPGLTHLVRALLGLGICARWRCRLSPADAKVFEGLRGVADSHHPDASFWAIFLGAATRIVASIFPVMPLDGRPIMDQLR